MVVQVCFPGNSMPHGQSGELMFLYDVRCVFPSGISSGRSLAKFAFQEMLVSLLLPKIPKSGSSFGVSFQEFGVSEQQKGAGGSQVLLPWFYSCRETGAVWHLDPVSSHLPAAPAPVELGTWENRTSPRRKSVKRSCAGRGSVQRLFLPHFSGIGFGGFPLGREGALECCSSWAASCFFTTAAHCAMV